jgi:predicted NAD/FAD-binding protein
MRLPSFAEGGEVRVAVVGGGISGLAAAWLLGGRHDVHLLEANEYVGGHTRTVLVPNVGGELALDMGFLVFNETTYPHLTRLFRRLDVETQPTDMSLSVQCQSCDLEYGGRATGIFAQPRNLARPSYYRMIADIARFNRIARRLVSEGSATGSLGAFLDRSRLGPEFARHYLVPLTAALWSAGTAVARTIPLATLLRFMENHGLLRLHGRLRWRTVVGGSHSYVKRMLMDLPGRVHPRTTVDRVEREAGGVRVHSADGRSQSFDHVVLATHADQALSLLAEPTDRERELLGAWSYSRNRTVLHTDQTHLPARKGAWASWNYALSDCRADRSSASVSYHLNRLQGLDADQEFVVTLNPDRMPADGTVLDEVDFTHPVYTDESVQTQSLLPELNGPNRTSFCGAYFGYGFHEDGLRAAVAVSDGLNGSVL